MKDYKAITLETEGHIATITLNRPEKLNAINDLMMDELISALDEIEKDNALWIVVLKGAGKSFSVGQDLSGDGAYEMAPFDPRTKPYLSDIWEKTTRNMVRWKRIFEYPRPIIAQVHGHCLGAGCELAMCCRIVIASEDAVFGDPSVRLGLASANPLWTWRIGLKKTTRLLLTGQYIDGKEAERIGLVAKTVPGDKLGEEVEYAASVLEKGAAMGGNDMEISWRCTQQIVFDATGMSTAWKFAHNLHALSSIQRAGRSITDRGGFDFYGIREKQGLKAALDARDKPYEAYFPNPKPKA